MREIQNIPGKQEAQNKFLAIEVNGIGFGIPINSVREIIYHTKINPLSQTPDFVRGVALIRQETIPLLDLNMLLGGDQVTRIHDERCFIVLQLTDSSDRSTQLCLLADRILQTYKVDNSSIDSPPVIGDEEVVNYVLGVTRLAEQIYILIDPAKLISPFLDVVNPYLSHSDAADNPDTSGHADKKAQNIVTINKNNNNKYLSVFINNDEYAFPLSAVSQVINKSALTDFSDQDIPDVLAGAMILDDKPIGIVSLYDLIARDTGEAWSDDNVAQSDQPGGLEKNHEVVVMVEYLDRLLGITVDRIGKTYDNDTELKQNSFCTDLHRKRIKSLGFIDKEDGSIEVIDPLGLLTEEEQNAIDAWMRCVDRVITMAAAKNTPETAQDDSEASNPLARFARSYLVVQVGDEQIGLDSADVDEVLSYAQLLPLKGGPEWFSGLLDLRQNTYPVIDLHIKLDVLASKDSHSDRNVLVMMKHGEQKIGMLVDKIIHSTHIAADQIHGSERSKLVVRPEALHAVADTD